MNGVNKVIIIGTLGADPDVRYTADGKPIAKIRVATNESWTDKQTGQKQERTEWHRVTFFGRLAEIAGEYLKKGRHVYVEGSLRTDKYTDKDGVERYSTEIVAGNLQMLGGGTDAQPPRAKAAAEPRMTGALALQSASEPVAFDDDIPF